MKAMNKRADNKVNFICLLPEELLLSIFDKVADLKSLCHCLLVSKHFAKVVFGVRTVSISIPDKWAAKTFPNRKKLVSQLRDSTVEQISELLESLSLQHLKLPVFLQKLKELEFVYLDNEYKRNKDEYKFRFRKIKFDRGSAKLESVVGLDVSSVSKLDPVNDSNSSRADDYSPSDSGRTLECFFRCNKRYFEWMCIILILVKYHSTTLRRVTISGSYINGKLVIGDEQLANIQSRVFDEVMNELPFYIMRAYLPVLHLPLSGWVLRSVTFKVIDVPTNPNASGMKLEETTFWDSDDDSKVFHEAVDEILKNHRHKIRAYRFDADF